MISQVSAFLSLLVASAAAGEDLQTLIEEALDQPVQLEIQDMPLDRAFETIATETGVVLTTAAEALDLLPYGANTEVTARMKNISLREGLSRLTVPLGLRFEVRDRGIEVLPTPALVRIGRRAKWDELDTLAWLHGLEFSKDRPPVDELGERLQFRVGEIDGWPPLRKAVQRVGAGPGDQVLTLACDSLDWTWYPDGGRIAVLPLVDQIRRQLSRVVSIRESHRKLIDVLQVIARQAGVPIRADPSVIASLHVQLRDSFSLYVANTTAAEAFEVVTATTGLGYRIEPDGVVFHHPDKPAPSGAAQPVTQPPRPDPYVGKIKVEALDGVVIELLLHESDLSPETNRLREKYLERADEIIKAALLRLEETAADDGDG
ncbi:MAG: hypothetical protein ACYSUQ_10250 [Planctomycetota bacterium]|jgi:xanthine/CO dehydrogenase XdhC/CoxF family maturation factor